MGIFSPPSQSYAPPINIPTPAPAPTPVDKSVTDAAARTKADLAAAGGYSSTNSTSGQGASGTAQVLGKTLLGM
jgi:hypothetical protein